MFKNTAQDGFFQKQLWLFNTHIWQTLVCPVKIAYVTKNNIFGLQMMVKSGVEKFILKSLHIFITEFVILGTFMK